MTKSNILEVSTFAPSVHHCLVETRRMLHKAPEAKGGGATRTVGSGAVKLRDLPVSKQLEAPGHSKVTLNENGPD